MKKIINKIVIYINNIIFSIVMRFKPDSEKVVTKIINKMLKPYKIDMNYVINNPKINGIDWFQYYTFNSNEEVEKWKKYSIKQLKRAYPYMSDKYIERQFSYIDLMWGLKRNFDEDY